ncbi:putative MORN repeat-containing protein 5 [Hypsibius exemplaris]|uniref:MORN repeat-containing protein 5 n=1 Tax=Hypsibius exemplaris TaxID=2072580 RepID=A0A9X6RNX8_HYPEX|nr:putative MORN repeat-containing protein 5 [Hypsibius exemplaris]
MPFLAGPEQKEPEKTASTHYAGATKNGRSSGYGRYTTKCGMAYEGNFLDDEYHGKGEIICPDGARFKGVWKKGTLTEGQFIFPDGLVFDAGMPGSGLPDANKPWGYCDGFDRRFWDEIQNDLSGKALLAAVDPIPNIPKAAMDVRNGYYNVDTRKIFSYDGKFRRNVDDSEHFWIISTCRKGWMEEVGKNPTTHL